MREREGGKKVERGREGERERERERENAFFVVRHVGGRGKKKGKKNEFVPIPPRVFPPFPIQNVNAARI